MTYKVPHAVAHALRHGASVAPARPPVTAARKGEPPAESRTSFLSYLPLSRAPFLSLSAELSGFSELELEATGVIDVYLGFLLDVFLDVTAELLSGWERIVARFPPSDRLDALRDEVLADPKLGPFTRGVLALWYTATWTPMGADWSRAYGDHSETLRVFGEAYPEGLTWRAGGLHPQGAKPTGFGSWALRPAARR
jgi:hypothetical protein